MYKKWRIQHVALMAIFGAGAVGCGIQQDAASDGGETGGDADADMDTDSDTDTDADFDTDADVDTDADIDTDSDTDTDADTDTDSDTDTDADSDTDTDTQTDTDTDTHIQDETDSNRDSDAPCAYECSDRCVSIGGVAMSGSCINPNQKCCNLEGPGDSDGDTDTDGDGDSDTDTDGDSDSDSDGDGDGDSDADSDTDDAWITITNGGFWQDIDGNRIEAHGAGFLFENGTWYWIGEDKSHNSGNFRAVNCYSSTNLQDWKFENAIITRQTHPDLQATDRIIERPKFIYNDTTKQYVMWLHWEGNSYADAEAGVFYSDTVCGDYTLHKHFRPNSNMSRDDTLFKDEDGAAYFISAANENWDLAVYELTADYLDVSRQVTTLWVHGHREAPAMFKDAEDRYFLVTSGCTGWDPNQGQYASSFSVGSGWTNLTNIGDGITYDTQPTYVIPVVGSKTTTYIYAGDRWQDPDLQGSKYIWLPIKKNDATLRLDYYDEWQLNVKTGEWRVFDGYIPQNSWSVIYVDR